MLDVRDRLISCFGAVFPNLDDNDLESATAGETAGWDSVATVTLVSLAEEEFGTTVDLNSVVEMTSFAAFEQYFRNTAADGE